MWAHSPSTFCVAFLCVAAAVVTAAFPGEAAALEDQLVPAQDEAVLLGAARAHGAVIWSHGRSLQ